MTYSEYTFWKKVDELGATFLEDVYNRHDEIQDFFKDRKKKDPQAKYQKKYIGVTKVMNCGLKATIIDYKNSRNITVQFEDGFIKQNVRLDKFNIGKVGYPK